MRVPMLHQLNLCNLACHRVTFKPLREERIATEVNQHPVALMGQSGGKPAFLP